MVDAIETPVVTTPATTTPAAVVPTPAAVAKPVVATTPVVTEPKRVRLAAGDDEIPDDAEVIEMSKGALASRLARASSKDLKKRFGTDDPDKIAADLKELTDLRKEKEDARVATLSEVQKATERADRAERERDEAQRQAREGHEQRVFERDDARLTRIAEKHIDPDYVDAELGSFARFLLKEYDKKQLRRMTETTRDELAAKFFADRVKTKPKLSKDYDTTRSAELKEQIKKDAKAANGGKTRVTNGANVGGRSTPSEGDGEKVLGQKSYKEIRENGFSWK